MLAVPGAPDGPKTNQHLELPMYLEDASDEIRNQIVDRESDDRHEGKDMLTIRESAIVTTPRAGLLITHVAGGGVDRGSEIAYSRHLPPGRST